MIRRYEPTDKEWLGWLLEIEGLENHEFFDKMPTWVLDNGDGFFTLKWDDVVQLPHLQHFLVRREERGIVNGRRLIKAVRATVRGMGFTHMIIHVPHKLDYLNKLVQYYFKKKPYDNYGGFSYYLVEV